MTNCCQTKAPAKIAELNRKVEIYSLQRVPDGQGGFAQTWLKNTYEPWAKIKPAKGKETVNHDRLNTNQMFEFTMRYFSGLNQTDKIAYKGQDYQIRSIVNVDEMNEWLVVTGEKVVAQ